MLQLPWSLSWGRQQLSGYHPTLQTWTVTHWTGASYQLENAVRQALFHQILDNRPLNLEEASKKRLDGYVLYIPLPDDVVHRCEMWDVFLAMVNDLGEHNALHRLDLAHISELTARISPIPHYDRWYDWRQRWVTTLLAPTATTA